MMFNTIKEMASLFFYDESGDQLTGMLIAILCTVIAGAAFMNVYSEGLGSIWVALQGRITDLIGGP